MFGSRRRWRQHRASGCGGRVEVGPQSAGAVPGPACYAKGGTEPTVTDASVVLGYLNPDALAGGTVPIEGARSHQALGQMAGRLQRGGY